MYSDFDQAFFIDFASGRTKKIVIKENLNMLIDFGPAINFTYVNSDFVKEKIFGGGIMTNVGINIGLTKHLLLETGLNLELLITLVRVKKIIH